MKDVFLTGFQYVVEGSGDDDRPSGKGWLEGSGTSHRIGLDFSDGTRMVGPPFDEVWTTVKNRLLVTLDELRKIPEFSAFSVE